MGDEFTAEALSVWVSIPQQVREQILSSVWCTRCARATTAINISGRLEEGDLILTGTCARCGATVARTLESQ